MKKILMRSLFILGAAMASTGLHAELTESEAEALYQSLVDGGATPEGVILALVDAGMSLEDATGFAISQADQVGFATGLAHAGVCLADDEWFAQQVANAAIEGASGQAKNAVTARANESVKNYGTGGCQGVEQKKKGAIPPFSNPPKGGVSTDS
jgi:hypothetical protein